MSFELNKTLQKDSHYLMELNLCQVRLVDNSNYPWIILIPMKNNIIEITDLNDQDYNLFNAELRKAARIMQNAFTPDKLNIATIGNIITQFHMHIIARFKNDKLFPKTVWGNEFSHYTNNNLKETLEVLRNGFLI